LNYGSELLFPEFMGVMKLVQLLEVLWVAFFDGVMASVDRGRISSTWSSAKLLTWSLTTSFSLNWRGMDLKDGLFDELRTGCLVTAKGL